MFLFRWFLIALLSLSNSLPALAKDLSRLQKLQNDVKSVTENEDINRLISIAQLNLDKAILLAIANAEEAAKADGKPLDMEGRIPVTETMLMAFAALKVAKWVRGNRGHMKMVKINRLTSEQSELGAKLDEKIRDKVALDAHFNQTRTLEHEFNRDFQRIQSAIAEDIDFDVRVAREELVGMQAAQHIVNDVLEPSLREYVDRLETIWDINLRVRASHESFLDYLDYVNNTAEHEKSVWLFVRAFHEHGPDSVEFDEIARQMADWNGYEDLPPAERRAKTVEYLQDVFGDHEELLGRIDTGRGGVVVDGQIKHPLDHWGEMMDSHFEKVGLIEGEVPEKYTRASFIDSMRKNSTLFDSARAIRRSRTPDVSFSETVARLEGTRLPNGKNFVPISQVEYGKKFSEIVKMQSFDDVLDNALQAVNLQIGRARAFSELGGEALEHLIDSKHPWHGELVEVDVKAAHSLTSDYEALRDFRRNLRDFNHFSWNRTQTSPIPEEQIRELKKIMSELEPFFDSLGRSQEVFDLAIKFEQIAEVRGKIDKFNRSFRKKIGIPDYHRTYAGIVLKEVLPASVESMVIVGARVLIVGAGYIGLNAFKSEVGGLGGLKAVLERRVSRLESAIKQ